MRSPYESYMREFSQDMRQIPVWKPGTATELGDYGEFKNRQWVRLGSIWDLLANTETSDLKKIIPLVPEPIDIQKGSAIVSKSHIGTEASGAPGKMRMVLAFKDMHSVYFRAKNSETRSLANLNAIVHCLWSLPNGKWRKAYRFVSEISTAKSFIVLIGGQAGSEITVSAESNELLRMFDLGAIKGTAGIELTGDAAMQIIGESGPYGMTLVGIRAPWWDRDQPTVEVTRAAEAVAAAEVWPDPWDSDQFIKEFDAQEAMSSIAEELLRECRLNQEVHPVLLADTIRRDVVPTWVSRFDYERDDWLKKLHHAVTEEGWNILKTSSAGLVTRGQFLGMAAAAKAIVIPISTPGYLYTLFDLLGKPMVHPDSADPQAKMLWDPVLAQQGLGDFCLSLGMLKETNYLDVPQMNDVWLPAVTAGIRFIYYHELGHVVHAQVQNHELPSWLDPNETQDPHLPFEMVADQFGLSMLLLEFRNQRDLLVPGLIGVVLALGLIAMKAYVEPDGQDPMHPIKRMNRLFDWAEKAKRLGSCTDEALIASKHFWNSFYFYFREVPGKQLPSPIYSLLRQTAQQPKSDWPKTSGQVLQWCAYGDRIRVLRTLRTIRDQSVVRPDNEIAKGILAVINFLVEDLREVDHVLGLNEVLR